MSDTYVVVAFLGYYIMSVEKYSSNSLSMVGFFVASSDSAIRTYGDNE